MKDKKILITGSSGTIGTDLSLALIHKGYDIYGIDIKPNLWSSEINRKTILSDLRKTINYLGHNFNMVIHLAGNARVFKLVKNPNLARDNFLMAFNILEFARKENIPQFIFAGSREIYGNSNKKGYKEENITLPSIESPYSATKLGIEALIHSYFQCYNISFANLRFSNVYGKYDISNRVIPHFIKLAQNNEDLIIYGKKKILDFTYIDDTINGILKIISNFSNVKNNTFNIASGKGTSIIDIALIVKELLKSDSKLIFKDNRRGEIIWYIADILKAKEKLGYNPKIEVREGILKNIEWLKSIDFI